MRRKNGASSSSAYELAEDIFGKEEPVGKTLLVNNSPFTVIGVMQKKTQTSAYGGQDKDHAVIPITTFKAIFGRDRLWVLVIHTQRSEEMEAALAHANEVMAARYGYDPKDDHVWGIWNTVKGQETGEKILLGMEIFFGIIGALTLVIGCVGVANIMYAVVKERTREIGVKMALGARRGWITGPFLLEGLLYTFVGGLAGAVIAILIVTGLDLIPQEGARRPRVPRQADSVLADRRRDRSDPRELRDCLPDTSRRAAPRRSIPPPR